MDCLQCILSKDHWSKHPAAFRAECNFDVKQLDVTDNASVKKAVEEVIKENGRLDVLINNAGPDHIVLLNRAVLTCLAASVDGVLHNVSLGICLPYKIKVAENREGLCHMQGTVRQSVLSSSTLKLTRPSLIQTTSGW